MPFFLMQDKQLTGTSGRVLNLRRGLLSQTEGGSGQDSESSAAWGSAWHVVEVAVC